MYDRGARSALAAKPRRTHSATSELDSANVVAESLDKNVTVAWRAIGIWVRKVKKEIK